jgi:hypothetical protein
MVKGSTWATLGHCRQNIAATFNLMFFSHPPSSFYLLAIYFSRRMQNYLPYGSNFLNTIIIHKENKIHIEKQLGQILLNPLYVTFYRTKLSQNSKTLNAA